MLRLAENGEAGDVLGDIDVLKIAHHGSKYSTTKAWLEAVQPEWAVISYGQDNRYGHPHQETAERLEDQQVLVFGTGQTGAVLLRTDGEKLRWSTWLQEKTKQ